MQINNELIPGTQLNRKVMGDVTGLAFLKKVFYITDGVMLGQIREISGIDGSTLQNWTKRGWVANAKLKRYNIDQVAHILIINMLRNCIQLDRIAFIVKYVNGDIADSADDIVPPSVLYDYICRILDKIMLDDSDYSVQSLKDCIVDETKDYEEKVSGAARRLHTALEIIIVAYYSALLKKHAEEKLQQIMLK